MSTNKGKIYKISKEFSEIKNTSLKKLVEMTITEVDKHSS